MSNAVDLVEEWLPLPDIAESTGEVVTKVRRWLDDKSLIGLKVGSPRVLKVPALFVTDEGPVPSLRGTIHLLADAGYSDEEAIVWLFTPDDSLPGRPIDHLVAGRKSEIRRRAQALAF